jgi:hypothetical protein
MNMLSQLHEAIKLGKESYALKLIEKLPADELLKELDGKGTSALDLAFKQGMNAVIGAIIKKDPSNLYQNYSIEKVANMPTVQAAIEAARDPKNAGTKVNIDTKTMQVLISRGEQSTKGMQIGE